MMIGDRRLAVLFHEEARHEAGHFIELCRMMSQLDPTQAFEFRDHGLSFLAADEPGEAGLDGRAELGLTVKDPEKWLGDLKEAIDLELHTLSFYQEEAAGAVHPEVKELLTRIMNHEKEDLAIFVRELQRLLHQHH
jgi:rubrerythrin